MVRTMKIKKSTTNTFECLIFRCQEALIIEKGLPYFLPSYNCLLTAQVFGDWLTDGLDLTEQSCQSIHPRHFALFSRQVRSLSISCRSGPLLPTVGYAIFLVCFAAARPIHAVWKRRTKNNNHYSTMTINIATQSFQNLLLDVLDLFPSLRRCFLSSFFMDLSKTKGRRFKYRV